jgi:hypothetical protein
LSKISRNVPLVQKSQLRNPGRIGVFLFSYHHLQTEMRYLSGAFTEIARTKGIDPLLKDRGRDYAAGRYRHFLNQILAAAFPLLSPF